MLKNHLKKYNIILASKSPRRQELFKKLEVPFTIETREIVENYPKNLKKTEITDFLANLKSKPFDRQLTEKDLLITSDTIVWFQNKPLGKPMDKKEAYAILQMLSGKKHHVFTSVSIKSKNFQKIINDSTSVFFKKLSEEEINFYINKYKPFDKAGSYGIQDWLGCIAVKKIKGSYFNVMGFPLHKLYKELQYL